MKTRIIIPAAGSGTRVAGVSGDVPKAMLPVAGKPTICHVFDYISRMGFDTNNCTIHVIVAKQENDPVAEFVKDNYSNRFNVAFHWQEHKLGLAHAISCIDTGVVDSSDSVFVILCDTILTNSSWPWKTPFKTQDDPFQYSWVGLGKKEDAERWCVAEIMQGSVRNESIRDFHVGQIKNLVDKPKGGDPLVKCNALVGVYHFTNGYAFMRYIREAVSEHDVLKRTEEINISTAILKYARNHAVQAYDLTDYWHDVGNTFDYHRTRRKLISCRVDNSLSVPKNRPSVIVKKSNSNKFINEILWMNSISPALKDLIPQVYKFDLQDRPASIEMEYYAYPTLSELMLYTKLHTTVLHKIIQDVWDGIARLANSTPRSQNPSGYTWKQWMCDKTIERLRDPFFNRNQISTVMEFIDNGSETFLSDPCSEQLVHGDLNFTNILYSLESGIVKFIDPRGSFDEGGSFSMRGFLEYDFAKILQSLHGYDAIVADVKDKSDSETSNHYVMRQKFLSMIETYLVSNGVHKEDIEKYIRSIYSIVYHQFVSMIPLHRDRPDHQRLFWMKSLDIMNYVVGPKGWLSI